MTSITPSPEMVERAKQSVLSEMSDRRLLNDVDDDLHDEIAAAIVHACLPALSCPDGFRLVPVEATAVEDWQITVDEPVLIYVVHDHAQYEPDEAKRKAEWERELKRTLYFEESHHPNREVFSILSYEP